MKRRTVSAPFPDPPANPAVRYRTLATGNISLVGGAHLVFGVYCFAFGKGEFIHLAALTSFNRGAVFGDVEYLVTALG